jgi:hypothetical protein
MALRDGDMAAFAAWPKQYGWWLERREPGLRALDGPLLPFRHATDATPAAAA